MFSYCVFLLHLSFFFFFNDTATTEIYTLSLHDALPISLRYRLGRGGRGHGVLRRGGELRQDAGDVREADWRLPAAAGDRKSTRLNSSHLVISYAVFCLKKKKKKNKRSENNEQIHNI